MVKIKAAAGVGAAAAAMGREAGASLLCRGMVHFSFACWPFGQDERLAAKWACAREETVSHRAPKIMYFLSPLPHGFQILHSAM